MAEVTGLDKTPFKLGDDPIEHASKNVASFWLSYMSQAVKNNQPVTFFSECGEKLVKAEYSRPLYRGLRGPVDRIYAETQRLANEFIEDQFQQGLFKELYNKELEMNEENQNRLTHIVSEFRKQS